MIGRRVALPALSLMMTACGASPTGGPVGAIAQFDAFWATFDREYSYFPLKGIDWAAQRDAFRPRVDESTSTEDLVAVLQEMVRPMRDAHVKLISPSGETWSSRPFEPPNNWDRVAWDRVARACALRETKPNLSYCTMQGAGYVAVGQWGGFSASDIDAVVDRFRDARALIVDVRMNSGGNDALAFALAGRFAATPTVSGFVRYRDGAGHDDLGPEILRRAVPRGAFRFTRPVIVLTGRGSLSSTESFVSVMRELPQVTTLGDTTGGASGNPRQHALGAGWTYSVSRWIEWTADRRVIEWAGIAPDVVVPWDPAAALAGRDVIIEGALSLALVR